MSIDPRSLIPRDKHDHERASAAVDAGYPFVDPILADLLEWIQDLNWPIAQTLAPFLASIGPPLIPHVKKIFESDDQIWKYWIMNLILLKSRPVAEAFRAELIRIVYAPTEHELAEDLPRAALYVVKHYGWEKED